MGKAWFLRRYNFYKKIAKEQVLIAIGTLIYALGVNIFLAPNKISGGGTTAIATAIYCKGMYSGEEKMMLYCIVSPKELPVIVNSIKEIDNMAFVVVSEVKEVLGEGFKVL